MAFRGRGGYGRGRVGGYNRIPGKPFVLFPENVELPDRKSVAVDMALLARNSRLRKYWSDSPYKIEETRLKKRERPDVETYSDMTKPRTKSKSDDLWQFIKRTQLSFPLELIKDGKGWAARPQKKACWNPDAAMQRWDFFEKLDQKQQEQEKNGENKKKEGESEDELDEELVEEDHEYSDDGDYNQNIDFDDDEDDYNMEDDHDDEPTY